MTLMTKLKTTDRKYTANNELTLTHTY